jgi:wyosine [tRNA(Phe)-imidazoG37] synthetase (radical SAM superfamily)
MEIAFGPVPSRRLGRSLGINNIPPKHCSYSCIYCQVGPTDTQEITPRPFYSPQEIRRQVEQRLDAVRLRGEAVDYLTFVPDGEPTLDSRLSETIDGLRDLGLPIAVISNATLIWREEVRAVLNRADWVSLKVDSVDTDIWRRINRPHPDLQLADILDGIRAFARTYNGKLVSETMLLAGLNDGEAAIQSLGHFLAEAGIPRAYLAIPHRPPAVSGVHGPDEQGVTRAYQILAARGVEVELLTGYEGEDFASSGDFQRDILAITAVHPLRESAVRTLAQKAGTDMSAVTHLLQSGELRRVAHAGESFYIRRFHTAPGDAA